MNQAIPLDTKQTSHIGKMNLPKNLLQRKCACGNHTSVGGECEECRQKREDTLRRAAVSPSPLHEVPSIVHEVLRSPGQPLDAATRAFMEPRFGHDFSRVRVHTDTKAAESTRAVNALAYTVGRDIVFGSKQYTPQTNEGRILMAHELTHVVQQGGQTAYHLSRLGSTRLEDESEREAHRVAVAIANGVGFMPQTHSSEILARQATEGRVDGSATSVSWINPASPAGAHVPDPQPPAAMTESFATGSSGFRFSNHLHAWVNTNDSIHITRSDFAPDSNIYREASYAGIPSYSYPIRRRTGPIIRAGIEGVEFEQLVGARTISPGVIGAGVGAGVGIAGGAWAGAKLGALIGTWGGPIGAVGGGIIGGLVGGGLGYLAALMRLRESRTFLLSGRACVFV